MDLLKRSSLVCHVFCGVAENVVGLGFSFRVATFRRSYRATPAWMTPPPNPTHPDPILTLLLTRFSPELDPSLTPNEGLIAPRAQNYVNFGSKSGPRRGSKSGRVSGAWGWGSPELK